MEKEIMREIPVPQILGILTPTPTQPQNPLFILSF